MDSVDKYVKQCKDNPLLCVIVGLLLLVVTQNCIMDIGLGEWLSIEAFSNITGEDFSFSTDPWAIGPAFNTGWWLKHKTINNYCYKLYKISLK